MAWLQDEGDENEIPQFEEEDDSDKEGFIEEADEEVIVTERPGALTPPPASKPKPKPAAKAPRLR